MTSVTEAKDYALQANASTDQRAAWVMALTAFVRAVDDMGRSVVLRPGPGREIQVWTAPKATD